MSNVSFFYTCFWILTIFHSYGALTFKIKFGIIVEKCFNKTKKFEEKLNNLRLDETSVAVVDAPCGSIVSATEQVCSLIQNDKVNFFVSLATHPLVGFYEMIFETIRTPKVNNVELKTLINDIADEFGWHNIFIYVDEVYGDVMPKCSEISMTRKSCHSVMVWTTEKSPEEFVHETLYYKDGEPIVRTETNYYILIVNAHDVSRVVEIAKQRSLFTYNIEWLIFATSEINYVMRSLRGLRYNSNVYIATYNTEEVTKQVYRNLLSFRNEWKSNYSSTYDIISRNKVKEVCPNIASEPEIKFNSTDEPQAIFEIFEVIPTRFIADPSLHLIAKWISNGKPRLKRINNRKIPNFEGVKLKVATLDTRPFVFVKKHNSNVNFTGFLIDLLSIAAKRLNFTYDIFAVKDDEYGEEICSINGTCYWSGVIGAVHRGEADIALANLTPLSKRAKAVLFLHTSLATGGFKMIYAKPTIYEESSNLWAYTRPFHYLSWICVLSLMLIMVLFLTANQKFKYFITHKRKSRNEKKLSVDSYKIGNPIFVAIQVLCQQGLENTPKDGSSRVVFIVMWLFSLLVFASYAATLTSYFTMAELKLPITKLEDYLKQTEYKLAFKKGSAYLTLMKSENVPEEYRQLNKRIQTDLKNSIVSSISKGFEQVNLDKKFIFAHDRITLKWQASQSCNMIVVGPTYMKVGVTIATDHNSQYYRGLDWALRTLKESGIARRYQKEYWDRNNECNLNNNKFKAVSIMTISAPLLILSGGLCSAILVVSFERFYNKIQNVNLKPPTRDRRGYATLTASISTTPTSSITSTATSRKKIISGYRMFGKKSGLRRRILSSRRSPRALALYL